MQEIIEVIGLKELSERYTQGTGWLRTILCRGEFNKFRVKGRTYYKFEDSKMFHDALNHVIELRQQKNKCYSGY